MDFLNDQLDIDDENVDIVYEEDDEVFFLIFSCGIKTVFFPEMHVVVFCVFAVVVLLF